MIDCTTYCITTSVFSDAQTGAEMGWNWDLQTQLPQVFYGFDMNSEWQNFPVPEKEWIR